MDWQSDEGKALLWKAYPDGYLSTRGVHTLHRYECISSDQKACWIQWSGERVERTGDAWRVNGTPTSQSRAHRQGGLLPLPDVTDGATWACLLQDLAQALGWPDCSNLVWVARVSMYKGMWFLARAIPGPAWEGARDFVLATEDAAEALVRAKIQIVSKGAVV